MSTQALRTHYTHRNFLRVATTRMHALAGLWRVVRAAVHGPCANSCVYVSFSCPQTRAGGGQHPVCVAAETRRASDSHVKRSVPCLMAPCKSGLTYMCTWGHALTCSLACIRLRGLWSSGWREMILLKGAVRCSGGRNETAFSPATARVLFTPEWTRQGPSGGGGEAAA